MKTQRHESCSDIIDFKFFFDNLIIQDTFETDNEALAWQKYNECQHPCELWADGEILAEKSFEEDPISDTITLVDTNYTGADYAEFEECEL